MPVRSEAAVLEAPRTAAAHFAAAAAVVSAAGAVRSAAAAVRSAAPGQALWAAVPDGLRSAALPALAAHPGLPEARLAADDRAEGVRLAAVDPAADLEAAGPAAHLAAVKDDRQSVPGLYGQERLSGMKR